MKIGIIGGGITGLTLGLRLSEAGHQVVIFERDRIGGLAGGFAFPGMEDCFLEFFYHHLFLDDIELIGLIKECGLISDLTWLRSSTALYSDGRVWNFQTPKDLLFFSPIGSLTQRILMGMNLLFLKHRTHWEGLDRITCRDFFSSHFNETGFEKLWLPLLGQKFGANKESIPAAFIWGRVHPRTRSRKDNKETLGYLRGGLPRLFGCISARIKKNGGMIKENAPAEKIVLGSQARVVSREHQDTFNKIIWTLPSYIIPEIIEEITIEQARTFSTIQHIGATCLLLILKDRLSEFYWLNNLDDGITFGALIEHTNFMSPKDYQGSHILYIVNYHDQDDFVGKMDLSRLYRYHYQSLRRLFPKFSDDLITHKFVFRNNHSCPLYDLNFSQKMPAHQEVLPHLHICNMEQIYPFDRNVNNCIKNAHNFLRIMK